jgi:hypothetical protein
LRSWNETKRTTYFCAAYFIAWAFNFLVPLFFTTLIVLIVYPPSRPYLFPPAPLALVDASSGGLKKPKAGVLGSDDSLTGAPEKHQGEAVEQEASNFVSSFAHITLSAAAGKDNENDLQDKEGAIDNAAPDPTRVATEAVEAKKSTGDQSPAHHDKTKQPMEEAMWNQLRPIMHIIGDIADGWERFAKYSLEMNFTNCKCAFADNTVSSRYTANQACEPSCTCFTFIVVPYVLYVC